MSPATTLPAHRLVLTSAEWAVLAGTCAVALPPGFAGVEVDEPARQEAASTLAGRGVVILDAEQAAGCRAVPSVAVNLASLAAPMVGVRVEVAVAGRGLRACFGIAGPLGASLFALDDGAVEVSMFPAQALGRELIRAVPPPEELLTPDAVMRNALGGAAGGSLVGRLPVAALGEYDAVRALTGGDSARDTARVLGLTAAQAQLAERVTQATAGTLWCLVTGGGGPGSDAVLVGQTVWLATDDGWVGVRPDPDGTDRQMVSLEPVTRDDIGVWIAPYVAQIVEAASERA